MMRSWYNIRGMVLIVLLSVAHAALVLGDASSFSNEAYAKVLKQFVDAQGMVDYAGLNRDQKNLTTYQRQLANLSPSEFRAWTEADQIALWINAYNAFTLQLIIDHYPVRRRLTRAIFPVGIRHIPGNWDRVRFKIMGRDMTLNEIEHETLRKDYVYPAIHLSLVCAAMRCPPLRTEPYVGDRLDDQHDDQVRLFLQACDNFRIDHESRTVHLSAIFDWFGQDFIPTHGADPAFSWGDEKERAVMTYLAPSLSETDRNLLKRHTYSVNFLSYDWSLNEQGQ